MINNYLLLIIFGYLLGSVPFGYLISRAKGVDIRKIGSGNIGGTNVVRALGVKWGLLVTILDLLKGIIPAYLATRFLFFDWQIVLIALSPALGHIFPVWLNFRGGKGMATTVGALFVLLDWKFFLIWIFIFLLVLAIFQIMSFASLSMSSLLPLVFWLSSFSLAYYVLGVVLAILIWWAHRENLKRIKGGVEPKFKLKKSV